VTAPVFGLIGALAAVPRRIAARDAARAGYVLHRGITRRTTHAVFGRRLLDRMEDAGIAARLLDEQAAGRDVLSENGFLRRLAIREVDVTRDVTRAALVEQSGLTADLDLLALFDAFEHDAEPFSFRDLILARKYAGLIAGGATWGTIVRSIHRKGPMVSLTAKSLKVGGPGAIYAEADDGLCELDGQLLLGFAEPEVDAEDLFCAAEASEARGAHVEAAELYAHCLALDPTDATAAYNRANCLHSLGRGAEAEADLLRALRHDPTLVEAWFNLAALLSQRGEPAAARRHLRRAIAEDPNYADAVFNLAALAFEAGDHDEAARCWARYLELDPESDWARRARRGLSYLAVHSATAI
jgi:tetratricopeptide (TPR) repeat protein